MSIFPKNWDGVESLQSLHCRFVDILNNILYSNKLKTNIEIKKRLLKKKYGNQYLVKMAIQFKTFSTTLSWYFKAINRCNGHDGKQALSRLLFRYIENTTDMWVHIKLSVLIYIKLIEFAKIDICHIVFLYSLNINCNSTTTKHKMCKHKCYPGFHQCKYHLRQKLKYDYTTYYNMRNTLPFPIITIINRYIHNRSY